MAFIGSMFSGSQGAGFQGQGINGTQVNQAYNNAGQGIVQQQNFLNTLAAQGGAQNQTGIFQQQQQLANQLQQETAGGGPNPALQQLQNTTGQNVANQAALAAGQRGAGANAGLLARQVGQQGAATQQQAVGQGAQMAAQQQLNAQGALQNQQANQANLATEQVGQQANALQNLNTSSQGLVGQGISSLNNQNQVNGQIAQGNQTEQQGILGGVGNAAGSILGKIGLADGGPVPTAPVAVQTPDAPAGPKSIVGKALNSIATGPSDSSNSDKVQQATDATDAVLQPLTNMFAKGGKVPAMVSPGEVYIPPEKVKDAAKSTNPIKHGEKIPGKAKVKGDSLKNDTVPKTLETGGIVLPKSVMESKHPHWAAHKFVSQVMAKNRLRKK